MENEDKIDTITLSSSLDYDEFLSELKYMKSLEQ